MNENVSILTTLSVQVLINYYQLFKISIITFQLLKSSLPAYKAISKYLDQANQFKEKNNNNNLY